MQYKTRKGTIMIKKDTMDKLIPLLYQTSCGQKLVKLLTLPAVSKAGGFFLSTSASTLFIDPFVRRNHIKMSDYQYCFYKSYNDFFTRKIKPAKRPVNQNPDVLISPCDGLVSVFEIKDDTTFTIKHSEYSLTSLLQSEALAKEYTGGTCYLLRLCVDNYHRYCYVDEGLKGINHTIEGFFHTVHPTAVDSVPVYHENSRSYSLLMSEHFGKIIQMEVGAMLVGKICNHHEKARVFRGQEKGYFEFGGSTILLFFKKDAVTPDIDLTGNTNSGYETKIQMGESIGRRTY